MKKKRFFNRFSIVFLAIIIVIIILFVFKPIKLSPYGSSGSGTGFFCTDSDSGTNYFLQGTLRTESTYTDYCQTDEETGEQTNTLTEYYCLNGRMNSVFYDCENGCDNGACIQISPGETKTIPLSVGNNYIALPLKPISNNINDIVAGVDGIQLSIYNNGFSTYTFDGLENKWLPDGVLDAGKGILVRASLGNSITFRGENFSSPASVHLIKGINLIAIPYCTNEFNYTVSQVLAELSELGKDCTTITQPNSSSASAKWHSNNLSYVGEGTRENFVINKNKAYWLTCDGERFVCEKGKEYFAPCIDEYDWTPSCVSPTPTESIISELYTPRANAIALTSSIIHLNWTNVSSQTEGLRIYRGLSAGNMRNIANLSYWRRNYFDMGLVNYTAYYYFVSAYNETSSLNSSIVNATTLASTGITASAVSKPYRPIEVNANANGREVALNWRYRRY